jgi:hypothetical protein
VKLLSAVGRDVAVEVGDLPGEGSGLVEGGGEVAGQVGDVAGPVGVVGGFGDPVR